MSKEPTSTRSWEETIAHFDDLVQGCRLPYEPMAQLVRRIAASPSSSELERNTSMHALLISNAPARSWRENVLRITFHPESRVFEFEYSLYDGDSNITRKRCPPGEAWDMLARFVCYKFGILLPDAP